MAPRVTRIRVGLAALAVLGGLAVQGFGAPSAAASGEEANPAFVPKLQPANQPPGAVNIAEVSNGCGGGSYSTAVAVQNYLGDTSVYLNSNNPAGKRFTVNFRPACNLHDAGYSGAYVWDNINGTWVDSFRMSRKEVDQHFLENMQTLCDDQIVNAPVALADCRGTGGKTSLGAESRYNFVVAHGRGYRPRPDLTGDWKGATDNISPPWTITQNLREVSARWCGNEADGHPNLTGELSGTLFSFDPNQSVPPPKDDEVIGSYSIHEGSLSPGGTMVMSLNGKDPDQLTIRLGTQNVDLVRLADDTEECPSS